jgi:nicotinamidase/pyrazinamidase
MSDCLIIVDVQNDFLPGGALAVPQGDVIIPIINRLQTAFSLVVATQDWHPANHGSFAVNHPGKREFAQIDLNGLPQTLWPVHCVQDSAGAELAPSLGRERIAKIFPKGTDPGIDSYSGFFDNGHRKGTGLAEWLRNQGVSDVYVCGLATDYCVKFTALDAIQSGFHTWLIEDACRGVNLQPHDAADALREMQQAGVRITSTAALLQARQSQPHQLQLYAGKYLALVREGHWEYAQRINATGAAIIVAVTDDRKLLLVEQYRIPVRAHTIELPAGITGDEPGNAHEPQVQAARRELLEETGYAAERVSELTSGPASSGLTSEIVTLFLASGLRRVGKGGGIGHEKIVVHEVPLAEVDAWLRDKARAGALIEPKVYAGLYFLLREIPGI